MSELTDCTNSLTARDILRGAARTGPPFYINVLGLSSFCADYAAIHAALNSPGSYTADQNALVCGLVDDGDWAGLDFFYDFGATVESDVPLNWITATTMATKVGNSTHVADTGVTSDGTSGYYNSGFNFGDGGSYNYVQNDAVMGVYIRTNNIETKIPFGVVGTGDCYFYVSAGNATCRINDDSSLSGPHADFSGMWILTRNGIDKRLYRNGVSLLNVNLVSTGVVNVDMYLLAWNNGGPGLYSNNQCSIFFGGKASTINVVSITNRIETYMDSKGIGVIP